MKTLIIISFFFSGLTLAQTAADSSEKGKNIQQEEQLRNQNKEMNAVQAQIGPKENPEAKGNINRKKKDVFIDKDGDGICDTRQSGMSFYKMRKRMGSGKKGPVKGQHGGGGGKGNQFGNSNGN